MAARFVYKDKDRTAEEINRDKSRAGGSYDSYLSSEVSMYKPKEGDNEVRILPRTWDSKRWGKRWDIELFLHYSVGPDKATYLCLDKMLNKPCPCCEARRSAADEEEEDALKPRGRLLCFVVDRKNERVGVQAWAIAPTLYKDIRAREVDKTTGEVLFIDHPDEGYDVYFHREGADLHTKYGQVDVSRKASKLHRDPDKQQDWLDFAVDHSLPDMLVFYPYEHIKKALFGRGAVEDDEETTDDNGGSRRDSREEEARQEARREDRRGRSEEREERAPGRRPPSDADPDEIDERQARSRHSEDEDDRPRRGSAKEPWHEPDDYEDDRRRTSARAEAARDEDEERPRSRRARENDRDRDEDAPAATQRRARATRSEDPEPEAAADESQTAQARRKLSEMKNRYTRGD